MVTQSRDSADFDSLQKATAHELYLFDIHAGAVHGIKA